MSFSNEEWYAALVALEVPVLVKESLWPEVLWVHPVNWVVHHSPDIGIHSSPSETEHTRKVGNEIQSLFVFSINGLKQNARSLFTPVSDPAFHALSHGT